MQKPILDTDKELPYKKRKDNYQSNLITKSRQKFTLQEKRIVAFIINQIDHAETYAQGQNIRFKLPLSEIAPFIEYKYIKSAAKSLFNKEIVVIEDAQKSFSFIRPFPIVKYNGKTGILEVVMIAEIVPYFIELGKQYTKYHFETFLLLDSIYSQRMYELLEMYIGRKQESFKISVGELQEILNSNYPKYYDFQRRVLDIAKTEMAEKAHLFFDYRPTQKDGKKVVEIEITIKTKAELAMEAVNKEAVAFFEASIEERNNYAKKLISNYKFTKAQQALILENKELFYKFMALESEISNGLRTVKNPTAYIATSLGFGKQKSGKN